MSRAIHHEMQCFLVTTRGSCDRYLVRVGAGSTWESIRWQLRSRVNCVGTYSSSSAQTVSSSDIPDNRFCGVAVTTLRNLESKRDSRLFGVLFASDAIAARLRGIVKAWVLVALTVCTLLVTCWHLVAAVGVAERVLSRPQTREIYVEADPEHEQACFSMGRVTIDYASGETGLPKVGFQIIDPRGREIEMLLAQAFLDCDEMKTQGYDPRTNRGWQQVNSGIVKVTLRSWRLRFIGDNASVREGTKAAHEGVRPVRGHVDPILRDCLERGIGRSSGVPIQLCVHTTGPLNNRVSTDRMSFPP
jgi:hypothetical protein